MSCTWNLDVTYCPVSTDVIGLGYGHDFKNINDGLDITSLSAKLYDSTGGEVVDFSVDYLVYLDLGVGAFIIKDPFLLSLPYDLTDGEEYRIEISVTTLGTTVNPCIYNFVYNDLGSSAPDIVPVDANLDLSHTVTDLSLIDISETSGFWESIGGFVPQRKQQNGTIESFCLDDPFGIFTDQLTVWKVELKYNGFNFFNVVEPFTYKVDSGGCSSSQSSFYQAVTKPLNEGVYYVSRNVIDGDIRNGLYSTLSNAINDTNRISIIDNGLGNVDYSLRLLSSIVRSTQVETDSNIVVDATVEFESDGEIDISNIFTNAIQDYFNETSTSIDIEIPASVFGGEFLSEGIYTVRYSIDQYDGETTPITYKFVLYYEKGCSPYDGIPVLKNIGLAVNCCQSNCKSLTIQEFTNLANKTNGWSEYFNIKKDTVLEHVTNDGVNGSLFSYNTVLYPEKEEGATETIVYTVDLKKYNSEPFFYVVDGMITEELAEGTYYVANYEGKIRLFDDVVQAITYQDSGLPAVYLNIIEKPDESFVNYVADLLTKTNGIVTEDTEFTQVIKFEITDPNGNVYDVVDEYTEAMIAAIEADNYTDITFVITSAMLGNLAGSNLTDGHYKINYDILSYLNGEAGNEIQFNYFNVCNIKGCVDKYIKDLPVYYNCANCNNEYVKRFEKIYHLYLAVKNAADCGNYIDATNILRMVQKLCNYKYCKNC